MKYIAILPIVLFALAFSCYAQGNLLSRVSELQDTAAKANGGVLGCGVGRIQLVTSSGVITVSTGLDPIHVFGNRVAVTDLLTLVDARDKANKTGVQNAMSGNVGSLMYVTLSTLAASKDVAVIPHISQLLDDRDDVIRGWSAIALFQLAGSGEQFQKLVSEIPFPNSAIQSAAGRGVKSPDWVLVRK